MTKHHVIMVVFAALVLTVAGGCHPGGAVTVTASTPGPEVTVSTATPPPPPRPQGPTHVTYTEEWVHLPVRLEYASGATRLSDEHRAVLREGYASVAPRTDIVRVRVEGHTDSRGDAATNERIAQERAQNVIDFLVGELGMPRELFEVESMGEEAPLTSGNSASDRLLNRRVEFSILVRRQPAM